MINIAIAGTGGYGAGIVDYVELACKNRDCRIFAAVRSRRAQFAPIADRLADKGAEIYNDPYDMIEKIKGRCDVVYITSSIHSHLPMALAAAKAGLNIHLEKPVAAVVQEVALIRKAIDDAGVICLVGFQEVNTNGMRLIKERLASGKLGKVKSVTSRAIWPRAKSYYTRNDWGGKLRDGDSWVLDGPATNAMAHHLNNILSICTNEDLKCGTPTMVRAELYAAGPLVEAHNIAAIEIQTAEGCRGIFLGTHVGKEQIGPIYDIQAEKGSISWGLGKPAVITYSDGSQETSQDEDSTAGRTAMVLHFLDVLEAGDPALLRCSVAEAGKTTLVINGAHESSRKIHRLDDSHFRIEPTGNNDEITVVDGLADYFEQAAARKCLISDLPDAPQWAVKTQAYDMKGYDSFPKQFTC